MAIPSIYIISLARAVERRAYMSKQMQDLGLNYTFVEAVDGQAISDSEIAAVYDKARAEQSQYGGLTRGEIACALSHKKIWQQLLESDEAGCIVLEDDALLVEDSVTVFSLLSEMVKPGAVVSFVATNHNVFAWRQKMMTSRYRLVYVNQAFIGAIGYYITQDAAKALLAHIPNIYFPIDFWYQTPGFKGVTPIKAIVPALVHEKPLGSTIGPRGKVGESRVVAGKQGACYARFRQWRLWLKNSYFRWPKKL